MLKKKQHLEPLTIVASAKGRTFTITQKGVLLAFSHFEKKKEKLDLTFSMSLNKLLAKSDDKVIFHNQGNEAFLRYILG